MTSPPSSTLIDSPQLAAAPFGTEGGRALLQRRVALFARVQGLISIAFLSLGTALSFAITSQLRETVLNLPNAFHLAAGLGPLAIWLVARRGRMDRGKLIWLDLGATVLPMVGYAAMALSAPSAPHDRYDLVAMLITMLVVMLRATVVPSRARVTTLISALACVPVLVVAYVVGLGEPKLAPYVNPVSMAIWCAAATVTATLATKVIYGLRQKAAEAERLGQYFLDEKIGEGGMGTVYRARHALLRRPTAIKLLPAAKAGEHSVSRFEREVQQTSRLTHPNTVAIYDYGHTPDGVFYYAMELLDGLNLQELVECSGPQPPARVIHVLSQVCGSLEEAHGIGLVHRDIKPANIILCERGGVRDVAKVVDFGLVKNVNAAPDAALSNVDAILGTPLYMAPESIRSPDSVDGRADLYALGAVGYFLLTGEPVFSGNSVIEVCGKHLHETPVPPSIQGAREVPSDLEKVILTCLAKKPEDRIPSARALRNALAACAVPAWTEELAETWWREHADSRSLPAKSHDSLAASPTVVLVDFEERGLAP